LVGHFAFAEETWRAFGYDYVPPRLAAPPVGFTPAARQTLELETTLIQELWAAAFGTVFDWAWGAPNFTNRVAFVAKVTELCIDGSGAPMWPAFRFATRPDAAVFLVRSGEDYLGLRQPADRVRLFIDRCDRHMSQLVPEVWAPIATSLFMSSESGLSNISAELDRTGVTKAVDDVEVQDVYLQIFGDRDWPRTLEAAVEQLLSRMSDADRKVVRDTAEDELGGFHFGWAMGIRNEFGMWLGNADLLEACGNPHPDSASMVIVRAVWERLQRDLA
jgi:hypothetical protein